MPCLRFRVERGNQQGSPPRCAPGSQTLAGIGQQARQKPGGTSSWELLCVYEMPKRLWDTPELGALSWLKDVATPGAWHCSVLQAAASRTYLKLFDTGAGIVGEALGV